MKSPVSQVNVIDFAERVIAIGGLPPSARTVSRRCHTVAGCGVRIVMRWTAGSMPAAYTNICSLWAIADSGHAGDLERVRHVPADAVGDLPAGRHQARGVGVEGDDEPATGGELDRGHETVRGVPDLTE